MTVADFRAITSRQAIPTISTTSLFDASAVPNAESPIDVFIGNTNGLNILYLPYAGEGMPTIPASLSSVVLLGYMSAVESFVRALVRRVVLIDDVAARRAEPMNLQFGAALHHRKELLPEALLEGMSFSGRAGIEDVLKTVLGIPVNDGEMKRALAEFGRICEIRHCCVHRFGLLGSRNAIRLGLGDHSALLERPFAPGIDDLQEVADLLRTFVKTLNNFVFGALLERTVVKGGATAPGTSFQWRWVWRDDKRAFERYYRIFASNLDSPPSVPARRAYDSFAGEYRPRARPAAAPAVAGGEVDAAPAGVAEDNVAMQA